MTQLFLMKALSRPLGHVPALRDALWGIEAGLLERIWRLAEARDPDKASDLGAQIGRLIGPHTVKHKQITRNLRIAFPHWLPHRIEDMALHTWRQIGRTIAEYPYLPRICDPAEGRIRVVDLGGLDLVRRTGKPGIFVSAHLANWNVSPVALAWSGLPLTVIYARQKNTTLEAKIEQWRAAIGCSFLEVRQAGRQMLRELQRGRSLGILMDQRYDRGEEIPFFGIPATTSVGPAKLALHLGLPLIPVRVQRLQGARFVITFFQPIRPEPDLPPDETARDMILKVNRMFERWIRETPEQWLCAKRRWPARWK
ncbi:lysophospholipid acyltransferase family protein [Benzoatithermus flavus]|uniref:KDO2-lipid IV(A) lauroyltransferase n=1 Tax=Benzoatithermus flavus TaxID=3108223 RepID=A0ABU8XXB6_9PROT